MLPAEARAVSFPPDRAGPDRSGRPSGASRAAVPADCTVEFHDHGASPASRMDISDPAFAAAKRALGDEWGRRGGLYRRRARSHADFKEIRAWIRC